MRPYIRCMKNYTIVFIFFTSTVCSHWGLADNSAGVILADEDDVDEGPVNINDFSYCFRFTWLGPKYDKDSNIKNETCKSITKSAKDIPCRQPLVATNNSNVPDTVAIWDEYQSRPAAIACRLVKGEVCAKYSYFFSGAILNITYMCTKVNVENSTAPAPTSGCFEENRNGHLIEVCICQSAMGQIPCNNTELPALARWLMLLTVVLLFYTTDDSVW